MSAIASPGDTALLAAPKVPRPPAAETVIRVARAHGVSPLRQLREMWQLRYGPGRLAAHEYVSTGAFRPQFDLAQKRAFVGREGSYRLNIGPNDHRLTVSRGFVRDKVLYTQLLQALGLPTPHTQALVHPLRCAGELPVLAAPGAVAQFLRDTARYALFGKPVEGSGSVGSVLLQGVEAETDSLVLGTGRRVQVDRFAAELCTAYPEGYVLQSALTQHPTLRAVTGDAVGTVRLVTTRDHAGIRPLYAVWKIPAPDAMSDNYWQDGSMIAALSADGRVEACHRGSGLSYERLACHPASGQLFEDVQIPHWSAVQETACRAHGVFPEFGVIGWDIGVTAEGPSLIEANDNPFHALYQLATGEGVRNEAFLPRFTAASEETARMLRTRVQTHTARQAALRVREPSE